MHYGGAGEEKGMRSRFPRRLGLHRAAVPVFVVAGLSAVAALAALATPLMDGSHWQGSYPGRVALALVSRSYLTGIQSFIRPK